MNNLLRKIRRWYWKRRLEAEIGKFEAAVKEASTALDAAAREKKVQAPTWPSTLRALNAERLPNLKEYHAPRLVYFGTVEGKPHFEIRDAIFHDRRLTALKALANVPMRVPTGTRENILEFADAICEAVRAEPIRIWSLEQI